MFPEVLRSSRSVFLQLCESAMFIYHINDTHKIFIDNLRGFFHLSYDKRFESDDMENTSLYLNHTGQEFPDIVAFYDLLRV